jgi:hypothetical protein
MVDCELGVDFLEPIDLGLVRVEYTDTSDGDNYCYKFEPVLSVKSEKT